MDAPETEGETSFEKAYLFILGKIMVPDEKRLFKQTKRDVTYWGARFLHALNTSIALFNIGFSLRES